MKLNRRDFLKTSLLSSLACSIPGISLAKASTNTLDHFFVQILVPGGMDVTLSLDPLKHDKFDTDNQDIFIEYRWDQVFKHKELHLGPACASLQKFMNSIATVNGIVMRRDVGHESLLAYMASGSGSGDLPYYAIEANHALPKTILGSLVNTSFSLGNRTSSLAQIADFQSDAEVSALNSEAAESLRSFYRSYETKLTQSSYGMLDILSKEATFREKIQSVSAEMDSESNEAAVIAASFIENLASSAILDLERIDNFQFDMDTHSDHEGNHLQAQQTVWNFIAQIFDLFTNTPYKQGSLFDHTTFVVVSEFSRTPYLNPAKGKDHNVYTNSALLAGGRINGGKSFGGSKVITRTNRNDGRALHIGSPFDFEAGRTVDNSGPNIELIFPENLARSMNQLFNTNLVYPSLNSIKPIKGLFK